jgi:hypothetical protein
MDDGETADLALLINIVAQIDGIDRIRYTTAIVSVKSCSFSPGKPIIKSEEMEISGRTLRKRLTFLKSLKINALVQSLCHRT